MKNTEKEEAIKKLLELPQEEVSKVLIFMAGLKAGCEINTPVEQEKFAQKHPTNSSV